MKKYLILGVITLMFSFLSCQEENDPAPVVTVTEFDLVGNAQKGPFINGSDVNIYELDNKFKPTGRTFHTNTDAKGHFELEDVALVSPYVEMLVDGFYFNEVTGTLSGERMVLKAIIDLTSQTDININVLTNLEFERVKYLISSGGMSLSGAKKQAQNELLKVFNMDSIKVDKAESLDIVSSGAADAVLLAVSSILQAKRTTAELSKLQADIILDMKKDGILSDTLLQSELINHSMPLNLEQIRDNLVTKYTELGVVLTKVNDFDKFVTQFNRHTTFHYNSPYQYPLSTTNGINILASANTHFEEMALNSFAVKMPTVGQLKIKMQMTDGIPPWYQTVVNHGWKVDPYDYTNNRQTFTSTLNDQVIDLQLAFTSYGAATIEFYYDNATTPSLTKNISWGAYNGSRFEFGNSPAGINLLGLTEGSEIKSGTNYVIGVYDNALFDLTFKIMFSSSLTVEVLGGYGNYTHKLIAGGMELKLKSSQFPGTDLVGGVSEIIVKFTGSGSLNIESDLEFHDGHLLKKSLVVGD